MAPTPAQLAALVAESCARSGVPVHVTDARALENLAALMADPTPPLRAPATRPHATAGPRTAA